MSDQCMNCDGDKEDYRHAYCDECWAKYVKSEYELCRERGCIRLVVAQEYEACNGKCEQHREVQS